MRAIIENNGVQIPVELDSKCRIPLVDVEVGKEINFEKVLLVSDGKAPMVGKPYVEGASVKAEVLAHGKDDKINVMKFKRRTKYRVMTGHRQDYTEILVKAINS